MRATDPLPVSLEEPSEWAALCRAMQAFAASPEESGLAEAIPRAAAAALGAGAAVVRLREEDGVGLPVAAAVGMGGDSAIRDAEAALAARVEEGFRFPPGGAAEPPGCASAPPGGRPALAVPLECGGSLVGTLVLFRAAGSPDFGPGERRVAAALATEAAVALVSARRLAAAERLAAELAAVQEIGQAIAGRLELSAVLDAVVAGALGLLGSQHAQIVLWDESRERLQFGAALGPEAPRVRAQAFGLGRGVIGWVARNRQPLLLNDYQRSPHALPEFPDVVATLTAPVLFGERLLGILHSHTTAAGRRFTRDDLRRLELLATQAAIAIENAQVYTRLEEAHREIRRSHHQLLARERLAAMGEMAAHLVHEIRNPLVAIGGFARRLVQRLGGREPEGRYAELIAREAARLEQILGDVRESSRESPMRLAATDLRDLVEECLSLVEERRAGQGVRLTLELCEPLPALLLDEVRVKQALLNLLANALEAMPEGGVLTVRSETAATAAPEERWLALIVSDSGPGIPDELLGQIFDPFFTTKEAGTGLGLTVVRRIAQEHGGRLEVESRRGEGATFRLWLPVRKEAVS